MELSGSFTTSQTASLVENNASFVTPPDSGAGGNGDCIITDDVCKECIVPPVQGTNQTVQNLKTKIVKLCQRHLFCVLRKLSIRKLRNL